MSMCGELENLEHEIKVKTEELNELKQRLEKLKSLMDETPLIDKHPDPDRRDWEYDGYGEKRHKDTFHVKKLK